MNALEIKNLNVEIAGKQILKNFSLTLPKGEVHAIMGPNGTGKSTLAKALAGHEDYTITQGEALLDGQNILGLAPDAISRLGLFLAFQYPSEIPGVSIANFLRAARQSRLPEGQDLKAKDFYNELYQKLDLLQMDRSFTGRSLNEGFSGGEKKRCEILQMLMLQPTYAIMDETDSGLDIDALRVVSQGVNAIMESSDPKPGVLLITHYNRILHYIKPDFVHVLHQGKIVKSGGQDLALVLERDGYDWITGGASQQPTTAP